LTLTLTLTRAPTRHRPDHLAASERPEVSYQVLGGYRTADRDDESPEMDLRPLNPIGGAMVAIVHREQVTRDLAEQLRDLHPNAARRRRNRYRVVHPHAFRIKTHRFAISPRVWTEQSTGQHQARSSYFSPRFHVFSTGLVVWRQRAVARRSCPIPRQLYLIPNYPLARDQVPV
jgi:hypothetical protein